MINKKKRLIVFGSSVAFGEGATGNYGWASMITDRIISNEWEVINCSVQGNRVKHLLERVYTDIVSLKPDAVIIAISLGNEGLIHPFKKYRYNRFINGIKELISIFKSNNIVPFVTNVYPNDYYKELEYKYLQDMNIELDHLDIPVINVSGAVDNLSGGWLNGMSYDSGHPNDLGHYLMSTAFSKSIFEDIHRITNINFGKEYFTKQMNTNFHIKAPRDLISFTLCFDMKPIKSGNIINIRNRIFIVAEKNEILIKTHNETKKLCGCEQAHISIMYHTCLNEVSISCNECQLYTFNESSLKTEEIIFIGKNVLFDNIMLYRGRLSEKIRTYIYYKNLYKSSIELFVTSFDMSTSYISNQIKSETLIEIIQK